MNAAATVAINDGSLQTEGIQWDTLPKAGSYKLVPGPLPGITGIAARGQPVALTGTIDTAVQQTGALSFWFATDRTYQTGADQPKVTHRVLDVSDSFSVSLNADSSTITLRAAEWGGPPEVVASRHIQMILPELPGPAWHHLALTWNGPTGEINVYLNGTPYYVPGEKRAPLDILPGRKLTLHLGAFALADVRLDSKPLAPAAIESLVPPAYKGQLDRFLGARDLGSIPDVAALCDKVLYESALGSPGDVEGWILEGPADVAFDNGWMEMKSQHPDNPRIGSIVHWCPQKFPDSFVAEWDFEVLSKNGLCIVFFSAWGHGNKSIFDSSLAPRNGLFAQYTNGDIDCYHISYHANTANQPRGVTNLRKNKGSHLVSNGPIGVPGSSAGKAHRIVLIKDGARIRMAVDGRVILDFTDDGQRAGPVLADGYIGLRQMQMTHARYRNFRVSALKR